MRAAYWTLRLGAAACFIGHGAFGIITKEAWVPYFGFVGIAPDWAFRLMPVVGAVDIALGVGVLLSPRPIVLAYMVGWALWTAMLRPLTGESPFETLERAGNYGVPLALLLFTGVPRAWRDWFRPVTWRVAGEDPAHDVSDKTVVSILIRHSAQGARASVVMRVLLVTTALLLFGHGGLAAQGKPLLASHLGLTGLPPAALSLVGFAEMSAALLLLASPSVTLLLGITAWKLSTEALFLVAGAPVWEFIERAGSYAAPLALALLLIAHPVRVLTLRRNT